MDKKYGIFSSSVDSQKLSLTVKGALKSASALAIAFAPIFGVNVGEINTVFNSLDAFLDGLDTLIISGVAVWGMGETVVGAFRKLAVALKIRK